MNARLSAESKSRVRKIMNRLIVTVSIWLYFWVSSATAQTIYLSCAISGIPDGVVVVDLDTQTVEHEGRVFQQNATAVSGTQIVWTRWIGDSRMQHTISRQDLSYAACFRGGLSGSEGCDYGNCELTDPPKRAF